ncbi:MAG TPA: hypothetical protein DHW82_03575 [Spirochaetia bacterium]|nr:MAG: hypothetical protein A2Y41_06335 [Spirochaetes bacterium GWB1_36_13]HCL56073.1 hypothetical protein [Spirochaetia bacterium]
MKYKNVLFILLLSVFMLKCENNKIDIVPKIHSVNVLQTDYAPADIIDFTSKNETWAKLEIHGENFFPSTDILITSYCTKEIIESTRILCGVCCWEKAGKYLVRAKNLDSDWSADEVYITVY